MRRRLVLLRVPTMGLPLPFAMEWRCDSGGCQLSRVTFSPVFSFKQIKQFCLRLSIARAICDSSPAYRFVTFF